MREKEVLSHESWSEYKREEIDDQVDQVNFSCDL